MIRQIKWNKPVVKDLENLYLLCSRASGIEGEGNLEDTCRKASFPQLYRFHRSCNIQEYKSRQLVDIKGRNHSLKQTSNRNRKNKQTKENKVAKQKQTENTLTQKD